MSCQISLLNLRLSSMLGLEINPNSYVVDEQNGNITNLAKSNTTLSELEEMLSMIAAQMVWTVGNINNPNSHPSSSLIYLTGEAEVLKIVLSSRGGVGKRAGCRWWSDRRLNFWILFTRAC
ncbi:hypothetical protein BS17DRAFT_321170 [Gyrodon lividus]|nr:hypothetical protein BS17DRAFT_321170 [Gyrodon lividus]